MGLLSGATSLAELIIKKFGDDIDGATQELVRMGGFPEPVARRIATGELPMDEASRVKRADEQGYGDVLYHGSTDPNIKEVSAGKFGARNEDATETGMWMSESPYIANGYSGGYSDNGVVYPLRYKSDEPAFVRGGDAHWSRLDDNSLINMNVSNHKIDDMTDWETGEDIPGKWDSLQQERVESTLEELDPEGSYTDHNFHWDTNTVAKMAKDNWNDSVTFFNVTDPGPFSTIAEHTHKDWDVPISQARFKGGSPADVATNHVVLKPYDIRSPNAAFDPQYTGSNIMGSATVPLLGATALGSAGLLAAPALMKDGVFQHGATSEPVVERKEPVRNQSGLLESVTDFGDEVFKSVRHAAGPLADVLMPYEGVNNYLKTVNDYDKQPTWWDRLGLLDL